MPSPFTSSFASAAAGNTASEGSNGRSTGSGDWYVRQQEGESAQNTPATTLPVVELTLCAPGHALAPTAQPKPFVGLPPPQASLSNEMGVKLPTTPNLPVAISMFHHT